ncbi:MAG: AI-2E family transporter [Clostridia bacterium]|nr:AI-2E family transporter [Clostridia bacterium]
MENYNFNSNNNKNNPFKFKGFGLFAVFFWAFFLAMALSNVLGPYFSQIINGLLTGITPLLLGIAIAFIFYRLVDFIEKVILKNAFVNSPYKFAIKRTISITLVLAIIIGIILLVFAILVPKIIEIVQQLTAGGGEGANALYNNVVNEICTIAQRWFGAEVSQESIKNVLTYIFDWFMATVGYINNLFEISLSVITGLFNVIISFLIAIFILKDKEKISKFARRFTYTHFRKEKADELCVMTNNANKILYNYVITKIIEFAIIFGSLGLTFMILNLEFTWELALIIGLFNFIPYFGIYIGTVPAVLITLIFNSVDAALYMALATIIITTIEFNVILPFITGKRLKVSSLVVVGSILIGGAMFGMMGMLFAPPIAALISVVITGNIELRENHMKYVMELEKQREKNIQEQQEQLGIVDTSTDATTNTSKEEPKQEKLENKENKDSDKSEKEKKSVSSKVVEKKEEKKTVEKKEETKKEKVKETKEK